MTRVIMRTIACGPNGNHHPNDSREVTEAEAEQLVKGGYAHYAHDIDRKARAARASQPANAENAMDDTMGETAANPPIYKSSKQKGEKA